MTWLIPVLIVVVWGVWVFNRLVHLRNRADAAWSDIDVQLIRRHDLIGNLVETVKGYAAHERSVLEEVVRMRGQAESARVTAEPGQAGRSESELGAGARKLFALAEAYPDLKASERFGDLQRALTDVENDLQNARRYHNAVVRDLNTRTQSFPDLLLAGPLGFREREFFELDDTRQGEAPRIDLEGKP